MELRRLNTLLADLKAGEEQAAWEIVETYGHHIEAAVRRRLRGKIQVDFDTDDCVQEVWMSLFRILPRLDDLEDPGDFLGLLTTITYRRMANKIRNRTRAKNDIRLEQRFDSDHRDHPENKHGKQATPSQMMIARETEEKLRKSVPEKYEQIVTLRSQGATVEEIACELEINERTVRRILQRMKLSME